MDYYLIIVWITIFLGWFIYRNYSKNANYFERQGIPCDRPLPIVGNLLPMMTGKEGIGEVFSRLYAKYKDQKIFGFFTMSTPNFIITDAELIKQITIKDFDHFVNHDKNLSEDIDKINGNMLFALTDQKWRDMRNILSPMFTSSKMKMMFGILSECANDFIEHFEGKANFNNGKVEVDCKDSYSRYTVDGISTAVLGFKGDCIKNEESKLFKFALSINAMTFWQNVKIFTFLFFKWLYKKLNLQLTTKEIREFFYNAIVKVMKERDEKGIFRPDVVQLLLQAKKGQLQQQTEEVNENELSNFSANIEYDVGGKNKKLTNWKDEHFMAQGFIFFSAGFETTNVLLQISTYLLAKNKDEQQELINEIDDVVATLDGKSLTYEVLHKMRYLDNVISESLRWWPPVFAIQRQCNKDIDLKFDGRVIKIKEGDLVSVPTLNIHHDERYYKDPEKFDPHRFDDDRKDEIVQGSYLPFGSGPRVCIGSRFALMEAKLLLFNVLSKFTFEVCEKTPSKIELKSALGQFSLKENVIVEYKLRK